MKIPTHVVQTSIGADGASFLEVPHFADNGGDTTSRKSSRSSTDQDSKFLKELTLFKGSFNAKEVSENADDGQKFVGNIAVKRRFQPKKKKKRLIGVAIGTYASMRDKKAVSKA